MDILRCCYAIRSNVDGVLFKCVTTVFIWPVCDLGRTLPLEGLELTAPP